MELNYYQKYYLSTEYIDSMFENAIIVFDASALLDLYYYSPSSQSSIFNNVFDYLQHRLWLPGQVYFEFQKNKYNVAKKPIQTYRNLIENTKKGVDGNHIGKITDLSNKFTDNLDSLSNQLKTLKEKTISEDKHPHINSGCYEDIDNSIAIFRKNIDIFTSKVSDFRTCFTSVVNEKIVTLETELSSDQIQSIINSKFQIGADYPYTDMYKIAQEGACRYAEQIPPGYEDQGDKIGLQKYGDLFVWKQILEYAKKLNKDILLVTNDVKPDWHDESLNAPRYELLKEFHDHIGKFFWSYDMKTFLYRINSVLDSDRQITDEVLKETDIIQEERNYSQLEDIDYQSLLSDLLLSSVIEPNITISRPMELNGTFRIFGRVKLFEGIDSANRRCIVMINHVRGSNYINGLRPLKNIFEIKKFYDKQHIDFDYHQFTLTSNNFSAVNLFKQFERPNIKKLYRNKSVKSYVGYITDEEIAILQNNFSVG